MSISITSFPQASKTHTYSKLPSKAFPFLCCRSLGLDKAQQQLAEPTVALLRHLAASVGMVEVCAKLQRKAHKFK